MIDEAESDVLDLRSVFGITARITVSAGDTGGACVEMDCSADPGSASIIHYHPNQSETYEITDGVLEVFHEGRWQALETGEKLVISPGEVHAFRNTSSSPARFHNRHEPALGFQDHLVTLDRLVQRGKIRGTRDPRSLIYMSMSAAMHRPDVAVRPPQWVVNTMAMVGRALRFSVDAPRPTTPST